MSLLISIDPGSATGALALFVDDQLAEIADLPVKKIAKASKGSGIRDLIGGAKTHNRHEIDLPKLVYILRQWQMMGAVRVIREEVGTRPAQGIVTAGRFMEGVGSLDGVCAALGIKVETVPSNVWKKATGTPADKPGACARAAQLFPRFKDWFKRTSIDHHRAEACLIGYYEVQHVRATG